MANLSTKECEICGGFFTPNHPSQKYCSSCGKRPSLARKKLDYAVLTNKMHAGEFYTPKEFQCDHCGKVFKSIRIRYFCSDKCKTEHIIENATCKNCGVHLMDVGIKKPLAPRERFCSEECKEEYAWKQAEQKGIICTCEQCGKKFIRKGGGTFCSRECYSAAIKTGWSLKNDKAKKEQSDLPTETAYCKQCGKPFNRVVGFVREEFCSLACRKESNRQSYMQSEAKRRQKLALQKQQAAEAELLKKGLCWKCKTPYPKCERMSSHFQYSPEGSVFVQGKVVKCPKYVG